MDTEIQRPRARGQPQGDCVRAPWAPDPFHPPISPSVQQVASWHGGLKSSYLVLKPMTNSTPPAPKTIITPCRGQQREVEGS